MSSTDQQTKTIKIIWKITCVFPSVLVFLKKKNLCFQSISLLFLSYYMLYKNSQKKIVSRLLLGKELLLGKKVFFCRVFFRIVGFLNAQIHQKFSVSENQIVSDVWIRGTEWNRCDTARCFSFSLCVFIFLCQSIVLILLMVSGQ